MNTELRVARIRAGLTQVELGVQCGVDGSTISRLEHGAPASTELRKRLIQVLGIEDEAILPAPFEPSVIDGEDRLVPLRGARGVKGVLDLVPVERSTIYRWMRQGRFPKPTRRLGSRPVWLTTVLRAWMQEGQR